MPLCFCRLFFSSATKWKNCAVVSCPVVIGPQHMTTNCDLMRCSHADHACYLDDDWRCHERTGPGHKTNREIFFLIKLFCQSFCISTCLDYDHLEHYGANAQNTYRRIHKSYCSRPIHTKRCYWAVILERTESRTLESHESLERLICLVCQVCQCLSWKRTLVVKSNVWNLKPNCIYTMQSIEQHYCVVVL